MLKDIIIVVVVALILGLVCGYIYKEKKSGKKCIGCPYASECGREKCECNKE